MPLQRQRRVLPRSGELIILCLRSFLLWRLGNHGELRSESLTLFFSGSGEVGVHHQEAFRGKLFKGFSVCRSSCQTSWQVEVNVTHLFITKAKKTQKNAATGRPVFVCCSSCRREKGLRRNNSCNRLTGNCGLSERRQQKDTADNNPTVTDGKHKRKLLSAGRGGAPSCTATC